MPKFTIKRLPLAETGFFNPTILSYVSHSALLKPLYDYEDTIAGFGEKIKERGNFKGDRMKLAEVLTRQYTSAGINLEPSVATNISSLKSEKTFTVTTGHQLNLLSGPLYVIFKLITTINLAEQLKGAYPDCNFVPVYWMATEDHDIAEIDHISIFGKSVAFETNFQGPSGLLSTKEIQSAIQQVKELLGSGETTAELIKKIEDAYSGKSNLADATRCWINSLLGKYGLVILDANEAELKSSFVPILKKEIEEQFTFKAVNEANKTLGASFEIQVNPRELNLFYMDKNSRQRIIQNGENYEVINSDLKFTKSELLSKIQNETELFSPNVLLRPVYQECILPNLAYVGGPAEINYWLELKFVFAALEMTLPVLMLRNCGMIIDANTATKWAKLGFDSDQLFMNESELSKIYLSNGTMKDFSTEKAQNEITKQFDSLKVQVNLIDPTLVPAVDSEKTKALNSVRTINEKVIRALKKKEETEITQIKKVKEKLFPGNGLQERSETILPFYLKYGDSIIAELKKSFDPFDKNFLILIEEAS